GSEELLFQEHPLAELELVELSSLLGEGWQSVTE
ncbi:unnamed protein product, partial [Urochloa humidicola]